MRRAASLWRDQGGSAAAEMALILPLTLALLFPTLDGAWYMVCEHRVTKGVRDAARYAARLDLSNYSCPAATFSGSTATIQNLARTGQLAGGTATVPGWVNGDVTVGVTCASGQGGIYTATGGYAPRVTVSARVTYPSLMGTLGFTTSTIYVGGSAQSPVIGL